MTTHYNAHGTTFACISSLQLQEVRDWALDAFGSERLLTDQKLIRLLDALEAAQHHIEVIEDAARVKAFASGSAAVRSGIGGLVGDLKPLGVGSRAVANQTDGTQRLTLGGESEDEPARLRGNGAI